MEIFKAPEELKKIVSQLMQCPTKFSANQICEILSEGEIKKISKSNFVRFFDNGMNELNNIYIYLYNRLKINVVYII